MIGHRQQSTASDARHVLIVGAGIVGLSVAMHLIRDGARVTLLDPYEPGSGCSSGNSGGFGIGLIAPIGMPGILRDVPRLLLDPEEPLFIDPWQLPASLPWFWRFLRSARPKAVQRIAAARAALNLRVVSDLAPLLADADCAHLVRNEGMLFVFDRQVSPMAETRFSIARGYGIRTETLTRTALRQLLPGLGPGTSAGVLVRDNRHCTDPQGLATAFARRITAAGGRILKCRATTVESGSTPAAIVDGQRIAADVVVIAAGVHSAPIVRALGYRVLLEAERGYHLMLPHVGNGVALPTTIADRNIVLTPMDEGLRITGIAEFSTPGAPPRFERARRLLDIARRYFPDLDGRDARPWMGSRPSTPDSLPIIGAAPRHPGLYFAFGHGQSGLAQAPVTGRIVSDLLCGRDPAIDLSAYSITRFA